MTYKIPSLRCLLGCLIYQWNINRGYFWRNNCWFCVRNAVFHGQSHIGQRKLQNVGIIFDDVSSLLTQQTSLFIFIPSLINENEKGNRCIWFNADGNESDLAGVCSSATWVLVWVCQTLSRCANHRAEAINCTETRRCSSHTFIAARADRKRKLYLSQADLSVQCSSLSW